MVTELRIYFEGDNQLRPGFHGFLKEIKVIAGKKRCRFRLIEAKGTPVQDFRDALKTHPDAWNVLLLDSEGPIDHSLADICRAKGLNPSREDSVFLDGSNDGILVSGRHQHAEGILRRWFSGKCLERKSRS